MVRRIRELIEDAPEPVIVGDRDYMIVQVNAATERAARLRARRADRQADGVAVSPRTSSSARPRPVRGSTVRAASPSASGTPSRRPARSFRSRRARRCCRMGGVSTFLRDLRDRRAARGGAPGEPGGARGADRGRVARPQEPAATRLSCGCACSTRRSRWAPSASTLASIRRSAALMKRQIPRATRRREPRGGPSPAHAQAGTTSTTSSASSSRSRPGRDRPRIDARARRAAGNGAAVSNRDCIVQGCSTSSATHSSSRPPAAA